MANELHTMPLKIERLNSSRRVRRLELDEFGAYIKILCDAWLEGGKLPKQCLSNAQELQKQCPCSADVAERIIKNVVNVFFHESEDGKFIVNDTLTAIYQDVISKSDRVRDRAKKGAAARWDASNAQAMPKQCLSNAIQSQSQIDTSYRLDSEEEGLTKKEAYLCGEPGVPAPPPKPAAVKWHELVKWDAVAGDFDGITEAIVEDWRQTYPAVNVGEQINKAAQWLRANPQNMKKNLFRFLVNWLGHSQERGGR
jgi:uncharacterized protein YdaU (DUF1376 family)